MAKQLFFRSQTAPASAHRGNNDARLDGATTWWQPVLLSESRGPIDDGWSVPTVLGPTSGLEVVGTISGTKAEWLSEPLSADFTISGTITLNLWALELTMNDNAAINAVIEKLDGATGVLTQIAKTARITEVALTTSAVNNFTVTPTSTVCKRGDRLRVRIFADDAGTMGAAGNMTFRFNGPTASVSGDSWIQFTENLTFEPTGDPTVPIAPINILAAGTDEEPINGGTGGSDQGAQSFLVSSAVTVRSVSLYLKKSGSPTDSVIAEIQTDSGGVPSGTVLGTIATIAATTVSSAYGWFPNACNINLPSAGTYWVVLRRTGARDISLRVIWGGDFSGPYPNGHAARLNSGVWADRSPTDFSLSISLAVPGPIYYLTNAPVNFSSVTGVSVSDDFNRANETPLASPWLHTGAGSARWKLAGNVAAPSLLAELDTEARYTGAFANDQYSQATIAVTGGASEGGPGVCVRADGARTWIRAVVDAAGDIAVRKATTGTSSLIGTRAAGTWSGAVLRIEVTGQSPNIVIRVFKNGVQVGADFTGVTAANSGNPGLAFSSDGTLSAATADSWQGGDIVTAPVVPALISSFTGADENPLSEGGNWANLDTNITTRHQRISNALGGASGAGGYSYWTLSNFGPDLEAYITLSAWTTGFPSGALFARIQGEGGAGTWDGYGVTPVSGSVNTNINRITNSVETLLITGAASSVWASGDKIGIRCVGSLIQAWRLPNGSSVWELVCSTIDTTYSTAGKVGLNTVGTSARMDDFYAATNSNLFTQKAQTTRGSGSVTTKVPTVAGPTAPLQIAEWYTPKLEAVTLGGKAKFNIRGLELDAATNASICGQVAIVNGDGSGAVVWAKANVEASTTNGSVGELPTTDGAVIAWVSGDDTAIAAGQRLRFRLLIDDPGDVPLVTGKTVTISYNGASAAAVGDSYIILPVAVTEQITGPQTYYGVTAMAVTFGQVISGRRQTFGQVAQPFTFGAVVSGKVVRTFFSSLAMPLSFGAVIDGKRKTFGQIALPVIFSKDVRGLRKTFGQIAAPFIFTKDVKGVRKTFGQIAFPITNTIVTAGIKVANTFFGVVALPVIFTKDVKGQRKTFGQIVAPFIFTKDVQGQRKTFGQTATSLSITITTSGIKVINTLFGVVSLPVTFVKDVRGQRKTFGQVAMPINVMIATAGIRLAKTLFGIVALPIAFVKDVSGQRKTFSQTAMPIIFSKDVRGGRKLFGQIVFPITFIKDVIGQRKTFGQLLSPFLFSKDVRAQRKTFGQTAFPITASITVAGFKAGSGVYGQVAFPITFVKDVKGVRKTFGQSAVPIVFAKDVKGVRKTFGQVTFPIIFTKEAVGRKNMFGQLAMQILFAKETTGRRKTFGQIAVPLIFTKDVIGRKKTFGQVALPVNAAIYVSGYGWLGAKTYFGSLAMPVAFNKQVVAYRKTFGQLLSPFLFSKDVRGQRKAFGHTALPIMIEITIAGKRVAFTRYGVISLPMTFVKDVRGHRKTFGQVAAPLLFGTASQGWRQTFDKIKLPIDFEAAVGSGRVDAYGLVELELILTMGIDGHIKLIGIVLNDALDLYLGEQDVVAAYVGSEKVWP